MNNLIQTARGSKIRLHFFSFSLTLTFPPHFSPARFKAAVQFPAYITEGNREMVKINEGGRLMETVF